MSRGAIRRFDLDGLYIPRDGMRVYEDGELDMDVFLFLFFRFSLFLIVIVTHEMLELKLTFWNLNCPVFIF